MNNIVSLRFGQLWQRIKTKSAAIERLIHNKQNDGHGPTQLSDQNKIPELHETEEKVNLVQMSEAETKTHVISTEGSQEGIKAFRKKEFMSIEEKENEKLVNYRLSHPEFLPDPNPLHRNTLREHLERMDMMARRSKVLIPEFYVGSVLAVTHAEPHSPTKTNRFVGICIAREGCGLRATFTLRNVVDGQGVEVQYCIYDPTIRTVECLRLEKRLDPHLFYLRDAPLEYSTFPFDMEPVYLREGDSIPINPIKVPLNPLPWGVKWERENLKGVQNLIPLLSEGRKKKMHRGQKPWEKYDLVKSYRSSIPKEDQIDIYKELDDAFKETAYKIRNKATIVTN